MAYLVPYFHGKPMGMPPLILLSPTHNHTLTGDNLSESLFFVAKESQFIQLPCEFNSYYYFGHASKARADEQQQFYAHVKSVQTLNRKDSLPLIV